MAIQSSSQATHEAHKAQAATDNSPHSDDLTVENKDNTQVTVPESPSTDNWQLHQDGYTHTQAWISGTVSAFTDISLGSQLFVLPVTTLDKPLDSALTMEQQQLLQEVCGQVQGYFLHANSKSHKYTSPADAFHLRWRTYFAHNLWNRFADLQLTLQRKLSCGIHFTTDTVKPFEEKNTQVFTFHLSGESPLLGSAHLPEAATEHVPLLSPQAKSMSTDHLITLKAADLSAPTLEATALAEFSITTAQPEHDPSIRCEYRHRGNRLQLLNPSTVVTDTHTFHSPSSDFTLGDLKILGEQNTQKHCHSLTQVAKIEAQKLTFHPTCADLDMLQNAPPCSFQVILRNSQDPQNTLAMRIHNAAPPIEVLTSPQTEKDTPKQPGATKDQFPRMQDNPIRANTVSFHYPDAGLKIQAQAQFARSYDALFFLTPHHMQWLSVVQNYVDPEAQGCESNTLGYAALFSDTVYICSIVVNQPGLNNVLQQGTTLSHEALHAFGRNHDHNVDYAPCEGSAKSAEFPAAMYGCRESFCYRYKAEAKAQTLFELDYSLGLQHPKMKQGLCKQIIDSIR
ncbi:MAG: hypothetical protein OXT67_04470 [Zetaproteobacteria bacterium]|nr:hypothetical protein [Zetaproteobacteria bacterium]